jgi:hypothetical protein
MIYNVYELRMTIEPRLTNYREQVLVETLNIRQLKDKNNPYNEMIGQDMRQTTTEATSARLPCRGCTTSCALYETCDGKPWRL